MLASVWSFANPSLFLWWWFTFPVCKEGGEGSTVHWCLFSFGAHMCKFLQLIVVVIPFFHFLPKWQPGNAKVRAKQHRAYSSSSQGPLEIWTKSSIFLMSLWEGIKIFWIFTKSKCKNNLYIRRSFNGAYFIKWESVKCSIRFSRGPCL